MFEKKMFNIWFSNNWPNYFPYFAKTASYLKNFKWYIFTNLVKKETKISSNIFCIPYSWEILKKEIKEIGLNPCENFNFKCTGTLGGKRKTTSVTAYRLLLPLLKTGKKFFNDFQYWGIFELDVLFGCIENHLPLKNNYLCITGHPCVFPNKINPRTCGPFTLFSRNVCDLIFKFPNAKDIFEGNLKDENGFNVPTFDESIEFFNFLSKKGNVFYHGKNLQPVRETLGWSENLEVFWDNGILTVKSDNKQSVGGFFHLRSFKLNKTFNVKRLLENSKFSIYGNINNLCCFLKH